MKIRLRKCPKDSGAIYIETENENGSGKILGEVQEKDLIMLLGNKNLDYIYASKTK